MIKECLNETEQLGQTADRGGNCVLTLLRHHYQRRAAVALLEHTTSPWQGGRRVLLQQGVRTVKMPRLREAALTFLRKMGFVWPP